MEELEGYGAWENDLIFSHGLKKRNGEIIQEPEELENYQNKKEYKKWAKKISSLRPTEYKEKDFKRLNIIDDLNSECILSYASYIIEDLLGIDAVQYFMDFVSLIEITDDESILNGVVISKENIHTKETIIEKVYISNINTEAHIVALVHEFMHYYEKVKKVGNPKNVCYSEILSQFAEKYAIKKITEKSSDEQFEKKIYSTRLESIKFHFIDVPTDRKKCINDYKTFKNNKNISVEEKIMVKENLRSMFPWVLSKEGIQDMWDYRTALRDSYALGYIYSDALLEKCLEDEETIKSSLRKYFDGKMSLETILSDEEIYLNNYELLEKSYEKACKILNK